MGSSIGCELCLMKKRPLVQISPTTSFVWTCKKKKKNDNKK